ncbi:MAG: hypothetical protein AAGJ37_03630 [Pseudomonadota bacterium]
MKFSKTLDSLTSISEELKEKGITVKKLDDAVSELSTHHLNIEKIEENIDSIKSEVIAPIKEELVQNKTAGKFSIFGFWVGALGLVASIGTLLFQPERTVINSGDSEILKRLYTIENQLLFPKGLSIESGEFFIEWSERKEIASLNNDKFYLEVESINDWPEGNGIKGGVRIFKNTNLLGTRSLRNSVTRSDGKDELREWFDKEVLAVDVGDKIKIGNIDIEVKRILKKEPAGRLIGDAKDGIVFSISDSQKYNRSKQKDAVN